MSPSPSLERHLRDFRDYLLIGNFSPSTVASYLPCLRGLAGFSDRPLHELDKPDVVRFLLHLREVRGLSPAYRRAHVHALRKFYTHVLGRPEVLDGIPTPRQPHKLLEVPCDAEVQAILEHTPALAPRTVMLTLYATGLRLREALALSPQDIDSAAGIVRVRAGKGGKDRTVMLSEQLLVALRDYWRARRPTGPWLFPGRDASKPLTSSSVHTAMVRARERAGIQRKITPHGLRHAFATRLMEDGVNLRTIQLLLGHKYLASTQCYLHVSTATIEATRSPLDGMVANTGWTPPPALPPRGTEVRRPRAPERQLSLL